MNNSAFTTATLCYRRDNPGYRIRPSPGKRISGGEKTRNLLDALSYSPVMGKQQQSDRSATGGEVWSTTLQDLGRALTPCYRTTIQLQYDGEDDEYEETEVISDDVNSTNVSVSNGGETTLGKSEASTQRPNGNDQHWSTSNATYGLSFSNKWHKTYSYLSNFKTTNHRRGDGERNFIARNRKASQKPTRLPFLHRRRRLPDYPSLQSLEDRHLPKLPPISSGSGSNFQLQHDEREIRAERKRFTGSGYDTEEAVKSPRRVEQHEKIEDGRNTGVQKAKTFVIGREK